eukprot:3772348-Heterocapsa_arctica.AAC.1
MREGAPARTWCGAGGHSGGRTDGRPSWPRRRRCPRGGRTSGRAPLPRGGAAERSGRTSWPWRGARASWRPG